MKKSVVLIALAIAAMSLNSCEKEEVEKATTPETEESTKEETAIAGEAEEVVVAESLELVAFKAAVAELAAEADYTTLKVTYDALTSEEDKAAALAYVNENKAEGAEDFTAETLETALNEVLEETTNETAGAFAIVNQANVLHLELLNDPEAGSVLDAENLTIKLFQMDTDDRDESDAEGIANGTRNYEGFAIVPIWNDLTLPQGEPTTFDIDMTTALNIANLNWGHFSLIMKIWNGEEQIYRGWNEDGSVYNDGSTVDYYKLRLDATNNGAWILEENQKEQLFQFSIVRGEVNITAL